MLSLAAIAKHVLDKYVYVTCFSLFVMSSNTDLHRLLDIFEAKLRLFQAAWLLK